MILSDASILLVSQLQIQQVKASLSRSQIVHFEVETDDKSSLNGSMRINDDS